MSDNRNAVVLGFITLLTLSGGCSQDSQTTAPSSGSITAGTSSTLAVNVWQSELTLLKSAGYDLGNSRGIFSLGWREVFNPQSRSGSTLGQAMAVGFDSDAAADADWPRGGVDMGSVYLNYGGEHLAMHKRITPGGGVVYTSSTGPGEASGTSNVSFIPGGSYEFDVTGSSKFSAIQTTLTAPSALINITSPAPGDSISSSSDLTLTWSGGNTGSGVLIAIVPPPPRRPGDGGPGSPPLGDDNGRMGPGGGFQGPIGALSGSGPDGRMPGPGDGMQGPGGMRGPGGGMPPGGGPPPGGPPPMLDSTRAIIVRLSNSPGTYTIAGSRLGSLVSSTGARGLMCTVSQVAMSQVGHDGGNIQLAVRNGDGVMVKIR